MENNTTKRIRATLSAAFLWTFGTEFSRLRLADFIRVYVSDAKHVTIVDRGYPRHMYKWKSVKSWTWNLQILRGAGYAHWLFGRRHSIPGFTFQIVWRGMKYDNSPGRWMQKIHGLFRIHVYRNGNGGWMPYGS